jgi:hypothetical protein
MLSIIMLSGVILMTLCCYVIVQNGVLAIVIMLSFKKLSGVRLSVILLRVVILVTLW